MKKGNRKENSIIAIIAILTLVFQIVIPIIPGIQTEVLAANETNTEEQTTNEQEENATEEISRNYEIKEEETWDISEKGDGSITAKWTLKDRTLTISGNGIMKDWPYGMSNEDWHNTKYTNVIEKVIINEGITNIGNNAFDKCINLTDVKIAEDVISIGESAFYNCNKLTNITIPEGVTNIGRYAFNGCSSLSYITIPERVTKIEFATFSNCTNLKEIIIPEGVTSIESSAFDNCSSLTNIIIPPGVTEIYNDAFRGCKNLEKIEVNDKNKYYSSQDGILFNKDKTIIIRYPSAKKNVEEYIIPNEVETIENGAFYQCENLKKITLPEGIKFIPSRGFFGCTNLTDINIPDSVKSIENSAFSECSSLKSITLPEGITSISEYAFKGCNNLRDITIPKQVTKIEKETFSKCTNLTNITISEGVTNIKEMAFWKCDNLKSITLPETITSIASSAIPKNVIIFAKADSEAHRYAEESEQGYLLEGEPKIYETNYEIKEEETWDISENRDESIKATWTLADKTLTIRGSGNMKNWEYNSNEDWHNTQYTNIIENIVIDDTITNIGEYAFSKCSNVKDIKIPEGVKNIKKSTFEECSRLESITIPKGVTSIENMAFYGCSSLVNITIPEKVINIGIAFNKCESLEQIEVNPENENYMSENGILFNKEKTKIIKYPSAKRDKEEYIIPNGVTEIEEYAFRECTVLTKITIPNGLEKIGMYSFENCSNLTTVTIPESVTIIENAAFNNCRNLTNIKIPEKVTEIKGDTFTDCKNLKKINIPEKITKIRVGAFSGCINLKSISIPKDIKSIENSIAPKTTIIYTKSNTEGERYAEEVEQGYIINDTPPTVIYTPNSGENKQKEYNIKIEVKDDIEEIEVNENSLKYQWTQSTEEPSKESFTESFENGQTITKNTGDGKWYLWVYAKDNVGNETIKRSEAYNFDNTAPTANVEYSTKDLTKENVTVTITANEQVQNTEGWKLSSDKLSLTKTYSQNTEETITIKDLAGNEAKVTIEISNIDKTLPDIIIGDINNDTRIDITDLLMLKRHIAAGSRTEWILTGNSLTAADMNEDGNVDITDMLMLKRKITEEI